MTSKRVVVVGKGIAGRSLLSLLLRYNVKESIASITSIECSDQHDLALQHYHQHSTTGLWPRATSIQTDHLHIPLSSILDHACPVEISGYRSVHGQWLAQPSTLQTPPAFPSLIFLRNNHLLHLLDESLQEALSVNSKHCTYETCDTKVVSVDYDKSSSQLILGTRDGHSIPADILFVADGSRSSLRSLLSSCPGGTSGVESHLHFRGYRVFRGIASHPSREAFQTWAPGSRFAVVPLTEGEVAWFAAISSPDPSDTAITMEGPLANETRLATLSERDALLSLFQSHHAPVMDLLSSTPQSNIFVTDSFVSSSRYRPQVAAYLHAQRTPVLFLGDARHTLDPILAQGAGRALEDAWSVCQILGDRLLSPPQLVQAYEQKGGERIRRLERMSSLAEFFGHVDSPVGCRVRDASLNALPMAWKRTAFDRLIRWSA